MMRTSSRTEKTASTDSEAKRAWDARAKHLKTGSIGRGRGLAERLFDQPLQSRVAITTFVVIEVQ